MRAPQIVDGAGHRKLYDLHSEIFSVGACVRAWVCVCVISTIQEGLHTPLDGPFTKRSNLVIRRCVWSLSEMICCDAKHKEQEGWQYQKRPAPCLTTCKYVEPLDGTMLRLVVVVAELWREGKDTGDLWQTLRVHVRSQRVHRSECSVKTEFELKRSRKIQWWGHPHARNMLINSAC